MFSEVNKYIRRDTLFVVETGGLSNPSLDSPTCL
jgi:hypothetical protein